MSFIFIFIYTFALGVSASYEAFPVIQVPVYIVGVCALGDIPCLVQRSDE